MNRIADAFEKHFQHFGFKKTTVDEVAAEIGVSKKTIYKLFRSKEDIFYHVVTRKAMHRKNAVEKEIRDIPTAEGKLETMVRNNFREFRKKHRNIRPGPETQHQAELASRIFRKTFFNLLHDIIIEGVEKNEFDICEPSITVSYIQSMIAETMLRVMEKPDSAHEDHLICTIKKIVRKTV